MVDFLSTQVIIIFIKRRKAIKDKFEGQLAWKTVNVSDNSVSISESFRQLAPQN